MQILHKPSSSIAPGVGTIALDTHGSDAVFSELSYAYPLKLLSPRVYQPKVAVVYVVSYGGGLVGGDQVEVCAEVKSDAVLVVLTQGSTKVFKTRMGRTPIGRTTDEPSTDHRITRQDMRISVPHNGALFLLPDPVTCFRSANYHQFQTIHLSSSASLVLLDWYTSGRKALGEEWVFERYYSLNEVFVDGRRVARDATLLEDKPLVPTDLTQRTLAEKMAPYACYATVLFYGPLTALTREQLWAAYQATTVFKQATRPNLLWSFSPLCEGKGAVVRVAALESEDVRNWLSVALKGLEGVIGADIYKKALG
ncbi:hypothetical protein EIP91_005546 [Steccherinum ochraceum]|uniref:Urease accessory protein n=1 Tax=Steccherinum ochraceum TaxID=92696 RepID=A0A4V2MXF9_9APHY|nr:hypothetical protein EIP91_005546 [Steccherinum ochraceum]